MESCKLLRGVQLVLDADLIFRDGSDGRGPLPLVIPGINCHERCLVRWHCCKTICLSLCRKESRLPNDGRFSWMEGFLPAQPGGPGDVLPCHGLVR